MKLLLHIGNAKTGTTALQASLLASRKRLRAAGVWLSLSTAAPNIANVRGLVAWAMDNDRSDDYLRINRLDDPARRAAWARDLKVALETEVAEAAAAGCDRFLVSSEHFFTQLIRPSETERLAALTRSLFADAEVICYLRRQDTAALSHYSELVRNGWVPPSVLPSEEFTRRPGGFLNYEDKLVLWADAFGDPAIRLFPHDPAQLHGGDVRTDFCHRLGLPALDRSDAQPARASLSADALHALIAYNREVGREARLDPAVRRERVALADYLIDHADPTPLRPSRDQVETFLARFSDRNAAIARRWNGGAPLFSADVSGFPDTPLMGSAQRGAALLAAFRVAVAKAG